MANLPPWKPLNSPPAPPKATPAPKGNAGGRRNYVPPKAVRPDPLSNSPIPLLHPPTRKTVTPQPRIPKDANVSTPKAPPRTVTPKAPVSAAKPAQLPSTSGKTTVPARTVTAHPAPPPKAKPSAPLAPKKPAVAQQPRAASAAHAAVLAQLSPQDEANAAVTAALAPLYAQQDVYANQQNQGVKGWTQALINTLTGTPGQISQDYDQAIGAQTGMVNAAADSLRAANPNTQDQALLTAIGAPDAQQTQLANQNNAAFNGAAAVGQYVGGVLPLGALQSQKLNAVGQARMLPAIEALKGQQALSAAQMSQQDARSKLDAQRPDLLQKYTASFTSAQNAKIAQDQKSAYLDIARQSLGLRAQNQDFSQKLAVTKTNMSIDKYNAGVTAKANKIDVTVSKSIPGGIARNSNGDPIIRGGKVITINANGTAGAKVPTASQINGFVDKWKNGKSSTVTVPATDKDGNPVYNPQTGAQEYVTKSIASSPPLNFGQAYRRLRTMNVSDKQARSYLATAYKRGEQGRGWLTNEEQSVLSKAGLRPRARLVNVDGSAHGVLSPAQYNALARAGRKPPAIQTNTGTYVIVQTN
jgi:hypothetical protein